MKDKILLALQHKALTNEELAGALEVVDDANEYVRNLYLLTQESLIQKHPVMDGCKTCACHITYKWRLTYKGRQHLNETLQPKETT